LFATYWAMCQKAARRWRDEKVKTIYTSTSREHHWLAPTYYHGYTACTLWPERSGGAEL
jgi:hypothetical protein